MNDIVPPTYVGPRRVLFLIAAAAEYGPNLRALFTPLMIGVGPVEAGVATAAALAGLAARAELPDLVVSLGSAGSRTLEQAGIYQVSSVSYRDMDATVLGFEKGRTPFLDLPAVVPLPCPLSDVPEASLATGASVVSGRAYDGIDADMVDMETYAVLRACQRFEVPLIGLRAISDGAAELRHIGDWTQYLHVVDEKLAGAVGRLEEALAAFPLGDRVG
jgi:adenosylhomocysteine nucleosidase